MPEDELAGLERALQQYTGTPGKASPSNGDMFEIWEKKAQMSYIISFNT